MIVASAVMLLGSARAEYRVALLLGSGEQNRELEAAGEALANYGFRCESRKDLNDKQLRQEIDEWARRTPVRSTALVYFAGKVGLKRVQGKEALSLLAENGRPVAIPSILMSLEARGGSHTNLLVIDSADPPNLIPSVWPRSLVAYARIGEHEDKFDGSGDLLAKLKSISTGDHGSLPGGTKLTGKGSVAISPPGRFVAGRKAGDEWVNARGMVFCWCPPGKFTAGSPKGTPGRYPDETMREVDIERGFWMSKYELTEGHNLRNKDRRSIATQKNHPVNMLHWDDGSRMVERTLTEAERKAGRLPEDWTYSLPTGDQWEYAARAGSSARYYFGDDTSLLPRHANFGDKRFYDSKDIFSNAAHRTLDDGSVRLAPAGSYLANPWGLHDIYGNVAEWCIDKQARGGSWVSVPGNCRSAYRDNFSSRNEQNFLGYRIIIERVSGQERVKGKK